MLKKKTSSGDGHYPAFFPLGGLTPRQLSAFDEAAATVRATPRQLALAWLLQRSHAARTFL